MDETLRAAIARAVDGRVRFAIVFGSLARGNAGPRSDVDVAVAGHRLDVTDLMSALSLATGREADVVDLYGAPIPLVDSILSDGVVVYEAEPGAASAWRARAIGALEIDRPWFDRMRDAYLERVRSRGFC